MVGTLAGQTGSHRGVLSEERTTYDDTKDLSSLETLSTRSGHHGDAFDTSGLDDLYKPISTYEGIHRYDPKFQWQDAEENKIIRKVCILPQCHGMETNKLSDRLANMQLGVSNVLRLATRSWKHLASTLG